MKVFAIAAHPDDIEFNFAGTLLLLAKAGCEIHYMNLSDGNCGSAEYNAKKTASIRLKEAKNSAKHLEAIFHPPFVHDLEIFYEKKTLSKLCSVVRKIAPDIMLVPSPQDYMEDHMTTSRLAVTAAFCRGVKNFKVTPPRKVISKQVTLYHAQPYGNRDALNQLITPDFFVNISDVIQKKTKMLAEHKSQKEWLDKSQGLDSYLETMKVHSRELGKMSGKFTFAEGWRRHNPLGFCDQDANPLREILGSYIMP